MTIRDDVRDAIESACTVESGDARAIAAGAGRRYRGFNKVRAIVLAVVRELPVEMTLGELMDELQISENQAGESD